MLGTTTYAPQVLLCWRLIPTRRRLVKLVTIVTFIATAAEGKRCSCLNLRVQGETVDLPGLSHASQSREKPIPLVIPLLLCEVRMTFDQVFAEFYTDSCSEGQLMHTTA